MKSVKPKGTPANRGRRGPGGCAICKHDKRPAIDLAVTYGQSVRPVAEQYQVHVDALYRHAKRHLSPAQRAAILTASSPAEIDVEALTKQESQGLLASLVAMRARLAAHAQACANAGDFKGSINSERVTLANLELVSKLVGQLISRSEVVTKNYLLTPGYMELRKVLIQELRPYPEIACRVAAAIAEIENDAVAEIATREAKPLTIELQPENHANV
jgi:hypothetical protein